MNPKLYLLILCFLFSTNHYIKAETDSSYVKNPGIIGLKAHYGFIIPHSKTIRDISYSKPWGVQLEYAKHINTQKVWDYCGCYPRIGFLFNYVNYDNPDILGNSYTLATYIEPFIGFKNRLNPSFRLGFGISYLDNVYDPVTNPQNLFYSYPLSFYMLANIGLNYRLNNHININLTGNYSHISNGRIKLPNKGINFPTISLGVDYNLAEVNLVDRNRQLSKQDLHGSLWKFNFDLYTSKKEVNERDNKYQVYGFQFSTGYIVSRISAVNIGVEVNHDRSLIERNKRDLQNQDNYNPTCFSAYISHEFLLGRFILDQAVGFYFTKPSISSSLFYQRAGLKYKLNKSLYAGINLKTHTSTADFIDLRMGVVW